MYVAVFQKSLLAEFAENSHVNHSTYAHTIDLALQTVIDGYSPASIFTLLSVCILIFAQNPQYNSKNPDLVCVCAEGMFAFVCISMTTVCVSLLVAAQQEFSWL